MGLRNYRATATMAFGAVAALMVAGCGTPVSAGPNALLAIGVGMHLAQGGHETKAAPGTAATVPPPTLSTTPPPPSGRSRPTPQSPPSQLPIPPSGTIELAHPCASEPMSLAAARDWVVYQPASQWYYQDDYKSCIIFRGEQLITLDAFTFPISDLAWKGFAVDDFPAARNGAITFHSPALEPNCAAARPSDVGFVGISISHASLPPGLELDLCAVARGTFLEIFGR